MPTYGFKRAQAEREKDWVLEVPQNADPMEDQFAKKNAAKAEKVAKNEIQRMRNIVKAKKGALPRTGYLGPDTASSSDVSEKHMCIVIVVVAMAKLIFFYFISCN